MPQTLLIDNLKTVLSSESRVLKTELFLKQTKNFRDTDLFIAGLAGAVILNCSKVDGESAKTPKRDGALRCFKLETEDTEHTFFFVFGGETTPNSAAPRDIIFFKYSGRDSFVRRGDGRLAAYLKAQNFSVTLSCFTLIQPETDFRKLYTLSNSSTAHFPLLNGEQKSLVAIEDQNVLVQGVAGSGKTNVCIDKIIFSAARGYAGRVLYSTFSRGLLTDTQNRVRQFRANLSGLVTFWEKGAVVFADKNHKKAVENKLGLTFDADSDAGIIQKINQITVFLDNNVDYFLIEDLYARYAQGGGQGIRVGESAAKADMPAEIAGMPSTPASKPKAVTADENYFIKEYIRGIKNHQLTSRLDKVRYLSYEVIYKEIYGVIFGCYDLNKPTDMLPFWDYVEKRKDSFSRVECEIIYALAKDYAAHLTAANLTDNNLMSRRLLHKAGQLPKYSLAVLDEVQDLTEVNLCLMKSISRKMFCVGDALQMINPAFFSFAYLKRLLFEKDIVSVAELSYNYRSTRRIAELNERLGEINVKQFGTHSFVLRCSAVDSDVPTSAVYIGGGTNAANSSSSANGREFLNAANNQDFNNYTIIVPSSADKEFLRAKMPKQEILTVAEIKGLERDVVVLYNVLSANFDKWKALERITVNRKRADENSVYRYYFNLFYVGISRGKTHVYVAEDKELTLFGGYFKENFENLSPAAAAARLAFTSDKTDAEQDELLERVDEFLRLEQYDNARFTAGKIINEAERAQRLAKIEIHESLVRHGSHREAGIRFWESGMQSEAREQFLLSRDEALIMLLDACSGGDHKELDISIVDFLPEVLGTGAARKLILQVIERDLEKTIQTQKAISDKLASIR